jgi:hypothetical protein
MSAEKGNQSFSYAKVSIHFIWLGRIIFCFDRYHVMFWTFDQHISYYMGSFILIRRRPDILRITTAPVASVTRTIAHMRYNTAQSSFYRLVSLALMRIAFDHFDNDAHVVWRCFTFSLQFFLRHFQPHGVATVISKTSSLPIAAPSCLKALRVTNGGLEG